MPGFENSNLFGESGPRNMLDYLQSRLAARDLSGEEALALLGAVHKELTNPVTADRGLYQKYSGFMEALQAQMPEIHAYVVSAWKQHAEDKSEADQPDERSDDAVESGETFEAGKPVFAKGIGSETIEGSDELEEEGGEENDEERDEPIEDDDKVASESKFEKPEAEGPDEMQEPTEESAREEMQESQDDVEKGDEKEEENDESESDEELEEARSDEEESEGGEEGEEKESEEQIDGKSEEPGDEEPKGQDEEAPDKEAEEDGGEIAEEVEEHESGEPAEGNKAEGEVIEDLESPGTNDVETEPFEEEDGGEAAVE